MWGWHNRSRPQGRKTREVEALYRPRVFKDRRVAELLAGVRHGFCKRVFGVKLGKVGSQLEAEESLP
jgi:hypothetical protein